jgi:hypothetical protein
MTVSILVGGVGVVVLLACSSLPTLVFGLAVWLVLGTRLAAALMARFAALHPPAAAASRWSHCSRCCTGLWRWSCWPAAPPSRPAAVVINTHALSPHQTALSGGTLDYTALDGAARELLRRHAYHFALADGHSPRQAARRVRADEATQRVWHTASDHERLADLAAVLAGPRVGVLGRLDAASPSWWTDDDRAAAHTARADLIQLLSELAELDSRPPSAADFTELTRRAQALITMIDELITRRAHEPSAAAKSRGRRGPDQAARGRRRPGRRRSAG